MHVAEKIEDEKVRASAIAGIAPHLAGAMLGDALQVARAIKNKAARVEALVALAPGQPNVLVDAFRTFEAIADEAERLKALGAFAVGLPDKQQRAVALVQALLRATAIKPKRTRRTALDTLTERVSGRRRRYIILHSMIGSERIYSVFVETRADDREVIARVRPIETVIGRIVFNPPAKMKVGRKERTEVRLTRDLAAKLAEGLRGRGTPRIEAIEIAERMRVRLLGEHFAITALSSEDQLVREFGFAQWDFDVVPQRSGRRTLRLLVTLRVKREGDQELCDLPALEREIVVQVAPVYAVAFFTRTHWKWLCASIFIPLIVWSASGPYITRFVDLLFKP